MDDDCSYQVAAEKDNFFHDLLCADAFKNAQTNLVKKEGEKKRKRLRSFRIVISFSLPQLI